MLANTLRQRSTAVFHRVHTRQLCLKSDRAWREAERKANRIFDFSNPFPILPSWAASIAAGMTISQCDRSSKWSLQWQLLCSVPLAAAAATAVNVGILAMLATGIAKPSSRIGARLLLYVHCACPPALSAFTVWFTHGKTLASDLLSPWHQIIRVLTGQE